jgi:hypothetical protein
VGHVPVFFGEDLAASLDYGNLCPQPAEGLGHFHGNRAGAQNDHECRETVKGEDLLVGEIGGFIQPLDGGPAR